MTWLRYFPPKVIRKRLLSGFIFVLRFFISNGGRIKGLKRTKEFKKKYVRPMRRYAIPVYQPGMKYCRFNKKYLRPTLYCNSYAPEIIALASQLGAYRKSDWEFAETAFDFVKHNITIEMLPLDNAEDTLRRGTGTCLHRLALLVALCRTAGIKTRYKLYTLTSMDSLDDTMGGDSPGSEWHHKLGKLLFHGEAEVYIDGVWVVGSVGLTPERQASLNLPVTRFGEISLGVWYSADPESIVQLESIPFGLNVLMKFVNRMAPMAIDNANANLLAQCSRGRAILQEKGEQAYDETIRKTFKPSIPEAVMEVREEITFER